MKGTLHLTIRGAKNVKPMDANGKSDPYCVYGFVQDADSLKELKPFLKRKAAYVSDPNGGKTRVMYETLNPVWKHRAAMDVTEEQAGKRVVFRLYDRDTVGKDEFMGQVVFSLEQLEKGVDGKFPIVGRKTKKDKKIQGNLKLKVEFVGEDVHQVVQALKKGDSQAVLQMISPKIARHKDRGASLLHLAAQSSCESPVLSRLIESGVDVNEQSLSKKTPLALACSTPNVANVRLLLDANADPLVRDRNGATLLHYAAMGGARETAELLIERGVDPSATTSVTRKSAIFIAAHYGNAEVLRCLIDHNASLNTVTLPDRFSPLSAAVTEGRHECLKVLLEAGADASEANGLISTPIVCAIRRMEKDPDTTAVKLLMDERYNVDVTAERSAALHAAVASQSSEVVAMVLARGADPNAKRSLATPLSIAVEKNLVEIARLLLQHGADVNFRLDTWINDFKNVSMLHIAVERQFSEMIDLLLKQKRIDVNCTAFVSTVHDSSRYTPLHCAVENNDIEAVKKLLAARADASIRLKSSSPDYDGLTPHGLAVKQGFRPIMKLLPKKGKYK
mmetsp:Transcript_5722/g.22130  ORF Transcript_5722/g.22130 Transcript_5722/m.22130 type:complete len:563 (+) Transcript_5722:77-1765(+)